MNDKSFFLDISRLAFSDIRSGIPRVAKGFLRELLKNTSIEYKICPVYSYPNRLGYWHANRFLREKLDCPSITAKDEPIFYKDGDIFLTSLDAPRERLAEQKQYIDTMYSTGVKIYSMVYDLLPFTNPYFFYEKPLYDKKILDLITPSMNDHQKYFTEWLKTIINYDGVLCISKHTATSFTTWFSQQQNTKDTFDIQWIHLGSNIDTCTQREFSTEFIMILKKLEDQPTVLVVSTLEPRKGHRQTLKAFELLWEKNYSVNLVFVGNSGWGMQDFCSYLDTHPEKNRHLFWLKDISDAELVKLYQTVTVLLMPSEGEGFGLPVVEAASHGVPLILRNIPVFKEIADKYAYYFEGTKPTDLVDALQNWFILYAEHRVPTTKDMKVLTWKESTEMLIDKLHLTNSNNF